MNDFSKPKAMTVEQAERLGWAHQSAAFADWYCTVDAIVRRSAEGMGVLDFPDWDFAGAFDGGMSPADTAAEFLEDMQNGGMW